MRSLIYAVLNFGALAAPVGVAPTAQRKNVTFKTLHRSCGTPMRQFNRCPACEVELEADDKVKGFEIAKNHFVVVETDELEAVAARKSEQITIVKFVDEASLEPTMVEKSYFLVPNEKMLHSYEIIADALEQTGMVGIGKATLWKTEYPVAVACQDGVLYLLILFCADELRSPAEIEAVLTRTVSGPEREMAAMFVEGMRGQIGVSDLTVESRERVMAMIDQKSRGEAITMVAPEPAPEPTVDYIAALRESVAALSRE